MFENNLTFSSQNKTYLTFTFLYVEETPLMGSFKAGILTLIGAAILAFGLLIQMRIYFMLRQPRSDGTVAVIDRLFKTHNTVTIFCYPIFLSYLMVSYHLFPMIDYIGLPGCIFLSHFLQVFTPLYCLIFPLTIAIVRFLFVVFSNKVRSFGINKLINTAVLLSILIPILMTISLQFPVYDYIHGPFNFCKGRFEVFFNPTHHDPITPGRREGERHCIEARSWALESPASDISMSQRFFRVGIYASCKLSRNLFYALTLSLPEMVLYPILFYYISDHNKHLASDGILQPDVIKRRRNQNLVNIYMTFFAWLAQFMTNMILVIAVKFVFGKDQFIYQMLGFVTVFFNFNVLPFVYIILANDKFKKAFAEKKIVSLFKLLINFKN